MSFTYAWPRAALTVDTVVFGLPDAGAPFSVLLIQRGQEPFVGWWALPGGFVHVDESLEWAARRELEEEAGLTPVRLEQVGAFGAPGRDPRERTVSVAFVALVRPGQHVVRADSDAAAVGWFAVEALPPLAFDHAEIVAAALARLRVQPEGWLPAILPDTFTLAELQVVAESIDGRPMDKRNFRKQVNHLVEETGATRHAGAHRPARLFRFRS